MLGKIADLRGRRWQAWLRQVVFGVSVGLAAQAIVGTWKWLRAPALAGETDAPAAPAAVPAAPAARGTSSA